MRSSVVGVVSLMLAVAAIGAGTALAQTPVVPATTVPAQPGDTFKLDPKKGDDQAKVDKEKVETPKVEKSGEPGDDKPKPESSEPAPAKLETGKPANPKPEPANPKPKPVNSKPKPPEPKPKAAHPKPTEPKPAHLKRGAAGASGAQPHGSGPERQVEVAKRASPRPNTLSSRVSHASTKRPAAAKQHRKAGPRRRAGAAGRERSGTRFARRGHDSADVTPVASGPATATPTRAPAASAGVAASADAPLVGQQSRVPTLNSSRAGDYVTLAFAIVFAAGVGLLFGRQIRRGLGSEARR